MNQQDINYSYKVNTKFAEAVYQKMASIRFGITFCCNTDLEKWFIKKELLNLNNIVDINIADSISDTPVVDPPVSSCIRTNIIFDGICPSYYQEAMVFLSIGDVHMSCYDRIDLYETTNPTIYAELHEQCPLLFERGCPTDSNAVTTQVSNWWHNREFTTLLDAEAAAYVTELIVYDFQALRKAYADYLEQYEQWVYAEYDMRYVPEVLRDIVVNCIDCTATTIALPLMVYMEIFRNRNVAISFTNSILDASTYGNLLNLNEFMLAHCTIIDS